MNDINLPVRLFPDALDARSRGALPLQGVRATGRLDGLLFELCVEQRYANEGDRVIEAVFTFPVPVRAVLLGLELELGGRKLEAVAVARAAATEKYERAIDAGDAAVLLELVGNGLYTVSVGNLKPGEAAVIRYRHAELLDANRGLLRLQVPTVIAPRYGNPGAAGLEGPAIPQASLAAQYPFDLEILLAGVFDDTVLDSPTHSIRTHRGDAGTTVRLAKSAALDRDFVLEVPQANVPTQALVARDGDEWVVVASAVLEGLPAAERRALELTVLLDCSGSMQGDSIEAAKRAVGRVLENLEPEDRLGLLRFGSSHHWVTAGLEACSRSRLTSLKSAVREILADLGGTEMDSALAEAIRTPMSTAGTADLLMITDGQVHDLDALVDRVAKAGRRLFVVAVGSAPNEALARRLSERTGGACEFVASGELAEDAILRMFRRLRAQPRTVGSVEWPAYRAWALPAPRSVFPDETVHLIAGFTDRPVGVVRVPLHSASTDARMLELPIGEACESLPALARLAAARRVALISDDAAAATALAVRHQIASAFTSFVVVAERSTADQARCLPATVAVSQMLPAGFAGANRMDACAAPYATPPAVPSGPLPPPHAAPVDDARLARFVVLLRGVKAPIVDLRTLQDAGVDSNVVDALRWIAADVGVEETVVVRGFLELLLEASCLRDDDASALRKQWALPRSLFRGRTTRRLRAAMRNSVPGLGARG